MFDHIGIVVADLPRSGALYEKILAPLNVRVLEKHINRPDDGWIVMGSGAPQSPFFVIGAGRPSFWTDKAKASTSPIHFCFTAPSDGAVRLFHQTGLQCGAKDNGAPGVRRAPFYCAFLIDYDGNNIEAGLYLNDDALPALNDRGK